MVPYIKLGHIAQSQSENEVQAKHATIVLTLAVATVACTTPSTEQSRIVSIGSATASAMDMNPSADAPSTHFNLGDVVFFYVKLNWANAAAPQGYRLIEWQWMKGEKVMATTTTKYFLQSAPRDIRTRIAASTLGEGVFTVGAYMEGSLLDKRSFTIIGRTSQATVNHHASVASSSDRNTAPSCSSLTLRSTGPKPAAQVAAC